MNPVCSIRIRILLDFAPDSANASHPEVPASVICLEIRVLVSQVWSPVPRSAPSHSSLVTATVFPSSCGPNPFVTGQAVYSLPGFCACLCSPPCSPGAVPVTLAAPMRLGYSSFIKRRKPPSLGKLQSRRETLYHQWLEGSQQ